MAKDLLRFPFRPPSALEEAADRVAEVMDSDPWQSGVIQESVERFVDRTRIQKSTLGRAEYLRAVSTGHAEGKEILALVRSMLSQSRHCPRDQWNPPPTGWSLELAQDQSLSSLALCLTIDA